MSSCQQALNGRKSTLQIIQTSAGKVSLIGSPDGSLVPAVKEQVMAQDILCLYACCFCHQGHKASLCFQTSKNRKRILLCIILVTVIDLSVHMNSQIRDHHQITVYIH